MKYHQDPKSENYMKSYAQSSVPLSLPPQAIPPFSSPALAPTHRWAVSLVCDIFFLYFLLPLWLCEGVAHSTYSQASCFYPFLLQPGTHSMSVHRNSPILFYSYVIFLVWMYNIYSATLLVMGISLFLMFCNTVNLQWIICCICIFLLEV